MRNLLVLCFWILLSEAFPAQITNDFFTWEEVSLASPDTVFYISFHKSKGTTLPDELKRFSQLKGLDLSRNNFTALPAFIGTFDSLTYLNLSRNKLQVFPVELCELKQLEYLIMNRNSFSEIPACICHLTRLKLLDLWSTPVVEFPSGMERLKELKILDLQGNRYSRAFQQKLKQEMPWVNIRFDPPCQCFE